MGRNTVKRMAMGLETLHGNNTDLHAEFEKMRSNLSYKALRQLELDRYSASLASPKKLVIKVSGSCNAVREILGLTPIKNIPLDLIIMYPRHVRRINGIV